MSSDTKTSVNKISTPKKQDEINSASASASASAPVPVPASANPIKQQPIKQSSAPKCKWTKTLDKLKNSICPQCFMKKPLTMSKTFLEFSLREKGVDTDVNIIACNDCMYLIKIAHKDAELEHKNTQILIQEKTNRILKLKLEFYSDEDTDDDDNEDDDNEDDDNEDDDNEDNDNEDDDNNTTPKNEKKEQKESKVFDFKTLKIKTKRLH